MCGEQAPEPGFAAICALVYLIYSKVVFSPQRVADAQYRAQVAMKTLQYSFLCGALILAASCDSSDEGGSTSGTTSSETEADPTSSTGTTDPASTSDGSTSEVETTDAAETTSSTGPTDAESSSTGATSSSGSEEGVEGDVIVDVNYEGTLEGSLTVAMFGACPPAGPPGAFVQEPGPVFPQTVELGGTGFAAGEMPCVIAYLDTGAPSPTSPGEEDPTGEVAFEIAAGEPTVVAVTLEDPA